jgi:hypothetical protein
MARRDSLKGRRELRRRLSRWRGVVESFARGLRVDPRRYAALHGELLQRCRALAEEAEEEQKTVYKSVEKLLQPWRNTEAFTQANRDILVEVLQRCRQAECELGGRPGLKVRRRWLRPALATLAGGTVLGVLVWLTVRWWLPLRSLAKGTRFEISMALNRLGAGERWMLAGVIAIVIAMVLLSRTAKS